MEHLTWVVAVWTMYCPIGIASPCWRHLDDPPAPHQWVAARFASLDHCLPARDDARKIESILLGAKVMRYATAQCRPLNWLNIPDAIEVHGTPL